MIDINVEISANIAMSCEQYREYRALEDKVEKNLTFDNPAYAKVLQYSKYKTTRVPETLSYYGRKNGKFVVPIGTNLAEYKDHANFHIVSDTRVFPRIKKFPEFKLTLRETQQEALEAYFEQNVYRYDPFNQKQCIQLPTGKGKTILALRIAHDLCTRTLIVVHKVDLVTGWLKDIELSYGKLPKECVGLIRAEKRTVGTLFTVATIQTLNNLSEQELKELYSNFGFIVQDEMHHCPANTFSLVNNFRPLYRLGLTATPERSDGLAHIMSLYFGEFCYKYELKEGETEEDILPVQVIRRDVDIYFNPVCTKDKNKYVVADPIRDYSVCKGTALAKNQSRITDLSFKDRPRLPFSLIDQMVSSTIGYTNCVLKDLILEYQVGHSCVLFFNKKELLDLYANLICSRGVCPDNIITIYGDNTPKQNEKALEFAENFRNKITLTTYSKSTEGTNVKQWECAFLVSSLADGKNVEQAVGRIRRVKEGHKITPVRLYDYRPMDAYIISRHKYERDKRYRKLGFDKKENIPKGRTFGRGFVK